MANGFSGAGCAGATLGGTVTELMSQGVADLYLTLGAQVTFFRSRYNKHTNFAMESIEQPFNTQVAFGVEAQANLNRTGDLIYFMYVVIDLPGIVGCEVSNGTSCEGAPYPFAEDPCDPCKDGDMPPFKTPCTGNKSSDDHTHASSLGCPRDECEAPRGVYAHYTNAVGQYAIKRACIVIGGQLVDTLYSDYLFMWEELSGKPGKRLEEMIGKAKTLEELIDQSAESRRLYVPLPFWFTQHSGNSLPLVSLQFHGISIHVCFEELRKLVVRSSSKVEVFKTADCQPLNQNDLKAHLDTTYIYLDTEERDRFAVGSFEQLIHQVQQFHLTTNQSQVRIQVNFNHPMIELLWAVRRRCQESMNNWSNYSGKFCKDPIDYAHLRLNNLPRFSGREGRYFRLVQPYQHHTNIPECFVYCFSFALHPEAHQPTGSCNFSRIDNVEFIFDLQKELMEGDGPKDVSVLLYGRNWNIYRYREGLGGAAFSNAIGNADKFEGVVTF